jgi:hypothetical protein
MVSAGGAAMVPEGWPMAVSRCWFRHASHRPSRTASQLRAVHHGDRRLQQSRGAPCSLEAARALSEVKGQVFMEVVEVRVMVKRMFMAMVVVASVIPTAGQSNLPIQGVWRAVEMTITESPDSRLDPFAAFAAGTHTRLQPGLMIFTGRHYSRTTDTAAESRPTTPYKIPGKPTVEELQAEWGPFVANAGTYEVVGTTLTLHAIVAKNPRAQSANNITRLTLKLDGNYLWLTPVENEAGKIPNPVTSKFVRVE